MKRGGLVAAPIAATVAAAIGAAVVDPIDRPTIAAACVGAVTALPTEDRPGADQRHEDEKAKADPAAGVHVAG
jgi:hypothetical protein